MNKGQPKANHRLDALIADLHKILAPAEAELEGAYTHCRYPLVLIVGAPRGGTTLLMQWLAASGAFAYPTNLLSRLSRAPAIAARLQRLLTDPAFAFGDDLFDLASGMSFNSDLGKTRGALAPNEFWYFWRRFLPTNEIRALDPESVSQSDIVGLRAALAAMEDVFEKPLVMKGLMIQFNIEDFAAALPEAFFIHIVRDRVYNAQSLLEARERYYGSRAAWYSAKPADYEALRALTPEEQVVGQILATHAAIDNGLSAIDAGRWMRIGYEDFCASPGSAWQILSARLHDLGYALPKNDTGPARFNPTNTDRLEPEVLARIRELVLAGSAGLP